MERQPVVALNGHDLRNLFGAGALWLESNAHLVNSLNVFPVPDGDTGTNMLLTMQASVREAYATPSTHAGEICAALSHGALLGARGNSGVIVSQIVRGFARAVDGRERIEARLLADALVEGARTAYKGVVRPVEGTILTVIREAADRAVVAAAQSDDVRFVLARTVEAARAAVARTPQLLPVLKEAGVVDAGGQGLTFVLEGALKYLEGEPLERAARAGPAPHLENLTREQGWGYDIQFHIRGQDLDVETIRDTISALGESALVVGDKTLVKVHVHAPNPGTILQYGAEQGPLVNIIIENMQAQYLDFVAGHTADERAGAENLGVAALSPESLGAILPYDVKHTAGPTENFTGIGTLAVVPGEGLRRIFESLGISGVVYGGPTMNPSAQDLLQAINHVQSNRVILLPNDKNIILAANQVRELTPKQVQVIPSRSVPQGVAALLAFNYQADLAFNVRAMTAALGRVRTLELTHATRAAHFNGLGVRQGQPIALLDGELVAAGDEVRALVLHGLHLAGTEQSEIVTLYYGADQNAGAAEEMRALIQHEFPAQEVEVHSGGQPLYPYLISIE